MRTKKRGVSLFITLCLIVGMLPQTAFATQGATLGTSGLCEHHTAHDETCGYVEAAEGRPCSHEHSEDCYKITESCTHTHTEECYPVLDSGVSGNEAVPSDAAQPTCGHACSEESGCITEKLTCTHTHDDLCGYIAAVEGQDCHYGCVECTEESETPTTQVCTCEAGEGQAHAEDCALYEAPADSTCTCETKCTEDAINADCAICSTEGADLSACTGQEASAAPVCDCDTDDEAIHATTCGVYVAPENPMCYCVEKCTEVNIWCDVCGFDLSKCSGAKRAVRYDAVTYDLWVGGQQFTSEKLEISGTTGTATYDPDTNTLTLNNYTYEGYGANGAAIYCNNTSAALTLTLNLEGENSVTHTSSSTESYGVYVLGNITVSGDGSLTATGDTTTSDVQYITPESYGVYVIGNMTITGGTVTATGGTATFSYGVWINAFTITGGEIIAQGETRAFFKAPSVDAAFTEAKVWYGENETAAEEAGEKSIDELRSNYNQKYVKVGQGTPQYYTVTVTSEGNGTASPDLTSCTKGTVVTLTAVPEDGYLLKEWKVVTGGVTVVNNQFTMPASDVTVTAVFTCDHSSGTATYNPNEDHTKHTVTYECCGEEITESHSYQNGKCACGVYPLWVGDAQFDENKLTINGSTGTAIYAPDTNTLTLNNFTYSGDGDDVAAINYYDTVGLKIVLNGNSSITGPTNKDDSFGLFSNGSINFSGSGSLTATSSTATKNSCGMYAGGGITVTSGSLTGNGGTINNGYGSYGVWAVGDITVEGGSLTGNGGNVIGNGTSGGVAAIDGGITVTGGSLTGSSGTTNNGHSLGVWVSGGDITIQSGSLIGNSDEANNGHDSFGVLLLNGDLTMDNCIGIRTPDGGRFDINKSGIVDAEGNEAKHVEICVCAHSWGYTVNGDTITKSCQAENCPGAEEKTIAISAIGKDYDGTAVTATVTNHVDSTDYSASIVYEAKTGTLTEGRAVNAGTYTAKITVGGATASVDFTISKIPLTIKVKNQNITYGQNIAAGTDQVTATGLVGGDTLTGVTLTPSISDVGTGVITPSAAEVSSLASNYNITYQTGTLTINKAISGIYFNSYAPNKTYDGTAIANPTAVQLSITGAYYRDVEFAWYKDSVAEANKLPAAPSNAGTYYAVATIPDSQNTSASSATSSAVTISPKEVTSPTITLEKTSYEYDGQAKEPAVTVKDGTVLIPDREYTVTYSHNTNAGTSATVTITDKEGGNYTISGTAAFTITKANPACTAPTGLTATYGQTLNDVTLTAVAGDVGTWVWSAPTTSVGNVGTHSFEAIFTPSDTANYNTKTVYLAVTVGKANLTIQAKDQTITYGQDIAAGTDQVAATGLVGGDTLTGVTLTPGISDVGTGVITPSAAEVSSLASNYNITYQTGTLTITQAAAQSFTETLYVTNNHAGTYTLDLSGITPTSGSWGGNPAVSFAIGTVSLDQNYYDSGADVANGRLTLPIKAHTTDVEGSIGTVAVTITSQNFAESTLTVTIMATNKTPVTIQGVTPATGLVYNGAAHQGYTGSPTNAQGYTGGYAFSYADAQGNPLTEAPTDAGSYTVTISVPGSSGTHSGSRTLQFQIAKKQLSWGAGTAAISQAYVPDRLRVVDTSSITPGSIALSGVVAGDDVGWRGTVQSASFADDSIGTGKPVAVVLTGLVLTGADGHNYLAPTGTLTITGDITAPNTGDEEVEVLDGFIVTKDANLPKDASYYGDTAGPALDQKFGATGEGTIHQIEVHMKKAGEDAIAALAGVETANAKTEVLEISLKYWDGDSWEKIDEEHLDDVLQRYPNGVPVTIPYRLFGFTDTANYSNYKFVVQHMITLPTDDRYAIGDIEDLSGDVTVAADGLHFNVIHGFSPFVVGFAETKTSQGGNTGNNGGNTGTTSGGGTSYGNDNNDSYTAPTYRNHEEDFWKQVEKTIREAKSDNKIIARARNYDRMPAYVMVALRERGHIMLEIHWNGGDTIIIPAGKALNEPNRIFYPLSYLEDYDFGDVQASLKHVDLNTGGEPLEVEAPAIVSIITTPDGKPEITDPHRGLADTTEDAKNDIEKDIPGVFEPETVAPAPDDATESQSKSGGLFAGIALLLAALAVGGGYLYFRKRKEAES